MAMTQQKAPAHRPLTIKQVAAPGELVKAGEIIESIYSGTELALQDLRVFDGLLENAMPEIRERLSQNKPVVGHWFYCPLSNLRDSHSSNDRVKDSIKRLAGAIIELPETKPNGERYLDRNGNIVVRKSSLIHGEYSYTKDTSLLNAELKYGFTEGMATAVQNSHYWARIRSIISRSMRSIYSYKLHQALSLRINRHQNVQNFDVEGFRKLLDVKPGIYPAFPQFNQKVLSVAEEEINALSDIMVEINVIRSKIGTISRDTRSRHEVVGYELRWRRKSAWELALCEKERQQGDIGRRERIRELNSLFKFDIPENENLDFIDKLKPDIVTISAPPAQNPATEFKLHPDTLEKAKPFAVSPSGVRLDVYFIRGEWLEWVRKLPSRPNDLDANFLAFVKTFASKSTE